MLSTIGVEKWEALGTVNMPKDRSRGSFFSGQDDDLAARDSTLLDFPATSENNGHAASAQPPAFFHR
jgi:hypothetical protein